MTYIFGIVAFLFLMASFVLSILSYLKSYKTNDTVSNKPETPGPQGKKGDQGPPGPPGPKGPAGGVYQYAGQITSLIGNNVLNRTEGIGTDAVVYLDKPEYVTNQYWKYTDDNQLMNQYGVNPQCLTGNTSGSVFINNCSKNDDLTQQWKWNSLGQLSWKQDEQKCLIVRKVNNLNKLRTIGQKGSQIPGGPYQIFLGQCAKKPYSEQLWYLGH